MLDHTTEDDVETSCQTSL